MHQMPNSHAADDPIPPVDLVARSEGTLSNNSVWPSTDHPTLQKLRNGTPDERQAALRDLFLFYQPSIRIYIHHKWPRLQPPDVEDLASEFVILCLTGEKPHLLSYQQDGTGPRVLLRTYLGRLLDHYLTDRHRHANAQIRGGRHQFESLDTNHPDAHQEIPTLIAPSLADAEIFDRHWAQAVLRRAFAAVETGNPTTRASVSALRPWILPDPDDATLKDLAQSLGRTHNALRAQLHRLRKAWRKAIREAVAETVSHPDEIDEELRHLARVLSHEMPD